jgi:hypothetical protein
MLTLQQLAESKRLPLDFLTSLGLRDTPEGVAVPYCDEDGAEIAAKLRLKLSLKDRADGPPCKWPAKEPIAAYGQWRLDRAAKANFLILVEGESDCWTLWYHDLPALGLPGAYTASTLQKEHVARVEKVYLWRENDQGGTGFVSGVYLRLRKLGFKGKVYEMSRPGIKDPSELHGADPNQFKKWFAECVAAAREMAPEAPAEPPAAQGEPEPLAALPPMMTVDELLAAHFEDWKWAVEGIVPEGVAILAGRPKAGKSWLALHLALAVACGGLAFGHYPAQRGPVLYLALEDGFRRIKGRIRKLLAAVGMKPLIPLTVATEWPLLSAGGIRLIDEWISLNPGARLVVIDTLARVRERPRSDALYQEDYNAIRAVADLARKHQVAVIIVHHTRKFQGEEPLDDVSGTTGLTGAADVVLVLRVPRKAESEENGDASETDPKKGKLYVNGRDVREHVLYLLRDPKSCLWSIDPDGPSRPPLSRDRQAIVDLLGRSAGPLRVKDIATALEMEYMTCAQLLGRMERDGQVSKPSYGAYTLGGAGGTSNLSNCQSGAAYRTDELPE